MAEVTQSDLPRDLEDKVFPDRIQDPEIAHEVANAEQGLQDKAIDMRTTVQASLERRLSPEQQQRRQDMETQLRARPNAWERVVSPDGTMAIVSRLVKIDQSTGSAADQLLQLNGLIISDNGPAKLHGSLNLQLTHDSNNYAELPADVLQVLTMAGGMKGKTYERARFGANYEFSVYPIPVEKFAQTLSDEPELIANLNRAEHYFGELNKAKTAQATPSQPVPLGNF